MPKSKIAKPTGRRERLEQSRKKAKRNRRIGILVVVLLVLIALAATALIIYNTVQNNNADTFGINDIELKLRSDGRFTATLPHDERYRGQYSLVEEGGETIVTLVYNRTSVDGRIVDDQFYIPAAWQDSCGHATTLPRR